MPTKQTFTAGQVLTAAQLNTLQDYIGVVQVKSATKSDTFSMTSSTFADVTGLSVSITPTSASNKVFVIVTLNFTTTGAPQAGFRLVRDSTDIGLGDAAGSRLRVVTGGYQQAASLLHRASMSFLDSPATTSATTYKVQMNSTDNTNLVYINRSVTDTDSASFMRGSSTITVFEVTP